MSANGEGIRTRSAWLLATCSLLLTLSGCSLPTSDDSTPPDLYPVGYFELTERSGRTVTNADLVGKVWVASFVFTRCTGPCPQVSGTVARLQKEVENEKDVRLVTFTVDPENDTLKELKEYADHFGADPERWLFLTGKQAEVYELLEKGFKVAVQQNEGASRQLGSEVTHSTRLVVVDRRGHIRGYFDGRQVDDLGNPVDDLPKLHATLNHVLREKP